MKNKANHSAAMNIARMTAVTLGLAATCLAFSIAHAQAPSMAPADSPQSTAGKYERITVHGVSLVGNLEGDTPDRMVSVYLPPSYAKNPKARYAVLYLLHGFTDSDSRWYGLRGPHFINVQRAVDRANAAGAMEMIIVTPDAFTKYQGSMYSSSATIGNWEAFITEDLVTYIDAHYRTLARRASRGLAGHSMGGYGTIRLGMKYPQVFSSLYAMSPCCLAASLEPNAELVARAAKVSSDKEIADADFFTKATLALAAAWSPNPRNPPRFFDLPIVDGKAVPETIAKWAANAPLAMVYQYIPNLKQFDAIALDAGDKDQPIADTVRAMDDILNLYRVEHVAEIYEGDHVSRIEERLEKKVLPFFSEHLSGKDP
ncbi:MAG TPA: alpha/beta fold hydrolase [Steroidobacteraceae bacterium]|nr:alpha/beta fold hydrolase [Steroidobacteraceae bacterium]